MKKLFLLAFVLMLAYILVNRQRVFIRDPLAKVAVNGAEASGYQVFINYSNDVLLQRDDGLIPVYGVLVQNWNRVPGTPATLKCIHWMACMTDADHASILPLKPGGPSPDPRTAMTNREVSFPDAHDQTLRVALR